MKKFFAATIIAAASVSGFAMTGGSTPVAGTGHGCIVGSHTSQVGHAASNRPDVLWPC